MTTIVIIIHLILTIALVGIVLIQRSEGGALGMGGGGGGGFMTGRSAANMMTRVTSWLAAGFFVTSLSLAIMANGNRQSKSILDNPAPAVPATQTTPAPKEPAKPEEPSAPLAK